MSSWKESLRKLAESKTRLHFNATGNTLYTQFEPYRIRTRADGTTDCSSKVDENNSFILLKGRADYVFNIYWPEKDRYLSSTTEGTIQNVNATSAQIDWEFSPATNPIDGIPVERQFEIKQQYNKLVYLQPVDNRNDRSVFNLTTKEWDKKQPENGQIWILDFEEKFTSAKIEYLNIPHDLKSTTMLVGASIEQTNLTTSPQEFTFSYEGTTTESYQFTHETGFKYGVETEFQFGIPEIIQGSITLSVETHYNFSYTEQKGATKTWKSNLPVVCPPGKKVVATPYVSHAPFEVDYILTQYSSNFGDRTSTGKFKGHDYFSFSIFYEEFDAVKPAFLTTHPKPTTLSSSFSSVRPQAKFKSFTSKL
jgi:hypothetical protein